MRFFRLLLILLLVVPTAAAAEPIRVTGKIEEPDPAVRIEIFPAWETYEQALRRLEEGTPQKPLATARPRPDGSFEIAAPEVGAYRLVARGEERFAMEHLLVPLVEDTLLPDTGLSWSPEQVVWLLENQEPSGWRLVDLQAGSRRIRFQVQVRDADDKPVPGALVRQGGRVVARTGLEGSVEIQAAPEDAPLIVETRDGWQGRVVIPAAGRTVVVRPQPPRTITGKVVDAVSKRPVAGALVWIGRPPVALVVRAGDDGAFRIAVPAGEEPLLEAAATGYLPFASRAVKPGEREPVVLTLEPSATLSGIVVDEAGRPVPRTRVAAHLYRTFPPRWTTVLSGADGSFRLTGLQPSGSYRVGVQHERFAPAETTANTAAAGQPSQPVRIVMTQGQTLSGRVVDESGRPVAGAKLTLSSRMGDRGEERSDEEGRFQIRRLRPGEYELRLEHPRLSHVLIPDVEVPPGQPVVDLGDVELPAGSAIEGRVVDAQGSPIAGAGVYVSPSDREEIQWSGGLEAARDIRTAEDGTFRIPGLRRGDRYDLGADHPGYVSVTVPEIEAPSEDPVQIVLRPGRSLAGIVVSPEGEPVADAGLSLIEEARIGDNISYSSSSLATTDKEGRFRADSLPPGVLSLEVNAEGYAPRRVDGVLLPAERDLLDLKIVLERGAQLDVQVLSTRDEPVPHTMIQADPETFTDGRPSFRFVGCETDSQGRCRIPLPGGGTYTVRATARGAVATARVEAHGGITPLEIRLPAGVEISGRVVGEDGAPAGGAYVQLESASEQFGVPTRPDGVFLFSDVADGPYRLKAQQSMAGSSSAVLEVVVAGRPVRDLELRLQKGGAGAVLTGRVLGLEPAEMRSTPMGAFPQTGGAIRTGRMDSQGEYRIQDLEAGEWRVQIFTSTGRRAEGSIRIEPGIRTASLDLELGQRGPRISGHVRVDGVPLPEAQIECRGPGVLGQGRTGYDGSFTFDLQEPRACILLVGAPQGLGASRPLQAAEDLEIVVEIRTGRLRGTVRDPDGQPVEGAAVTIEGWSPELQTSFSSRTLRSGPDGAFDAPRLASGTVRISIQAPGFAAAETLTEIPPGGEGVVEIRLGSQDPR